MAGAKRVGRARQAQEMASYLFEIEHVHGHYSFGSGSRHDRTAYSEYLHPEIDAICVSPPKLAGRRTAFTIIGDRQIEQELWMQETAQEDATVIGSLTMRGSQSQYLGSLPYDAAWRITAAIMSGGFRFIYLHGEVLARGTARIRSMGFYREFDIADA